MKRALIVLALSVAALDAHAISRHTTTGMSCESIKAIVANEGAAILQWRSLRNPGLPIYGRYVAHRGFCRQEERAETAYVPAADDQSCAVRKCERIIRLRQGRAFR
ncbi:MAG: hypothetical protein H0T56_10030 [Pseudaminobacter sp.]|nr:hypothetical protein [Pseudaminobacter sp.]